MKKTFLATALAGVVLISGCTQTTGTTDSYGSNTETTPTSSTTNTTNMRTEPQKGDTVATLETNKGDIKMFFYQDLAPETSKNFIELAKAGKYDGVIFHRVIDNFMIQGGDFEKKNGTGGHSYKGPGTTINDEFGKGLTHLYGAVSMANAGANTGASQFFIVENSQGTSFLDGKHAIFAYVYDGMDVVEKIAEVETLPGDRPVDDVIIEKVVIETF